MNAKKINYVFLSFLILLGVGYFIEAISIEHASTESIGPSYFPTMLSILLVIFCAISLFQTLAKKHEDKIKLPNAKYVLYTLGMIIVFYLSWYLIGMFYINAFLFLFLLMTIYTKKEDRKRLILNNFIISLVVTGVLYLLFDVVLLIRF